MRRPIIGYFLKVAEGQKLLAEFADIQAWWDAHRKTSEPGSGLT